MYFLQNKFRIRSRHICDHDLKVLASYELLPNMSEVKEFRGTLTVEFKRTNKSAAEPKKKSKPSGLRKILRTKSKKSQDIPEEFLPDLDGGDSYQTYSFHLKIPKEEQQVQFQLICFSSRLFINYRDLWDNKTLPSLIFLYILFFSSRDETARDTVPGCFD